MNSDAPPIHTCWICNRPVCLETCKTDEHGNPVHEECQFLRMALAKAPKTAKSQKSRAIG